MRNFSKVKKLVVKIGTNTLSKRDSIKIDDAYIRRLAKQIAQLRRKKIQIVIVTSGAIGMGAGHLELEKTDGPKVRQACAAIGQPLLMDAYKKAFSKHNIITAQVLITSDVLDHKVTYENLRNAMDQILEMEVIPIINENDCVSTEEINLAFGDNDKLSARVASKIEADLLILLTDIDALYDKDPRKHKDTAKPISLVKKITKEIIASAGDPGTKHATGGMKSKIEAVKIAFDAGCRIVLANGRTTDIITKIMNGDEIGTLFTQEGIKKLNDHERWIANRRPTGQIEIDPTYKKKITKPENILPKHIRSITGVFSKKSVVTLSPGTSDHTFKAITQLDSDQINCFKGKTQGEIKKLFGAGRGSVIAVKCSDIVRIKN